MTIPKGLSGEAEAMWKTMDEIMAALGRGYGVETTASKAPWNHTGKRVWYATKHGARVAEAFSPKQLIAKVQKLKKVCPVCGDADCGTKSRKCGK